jgi:hypothetical protein
MNIRKELRYAARSVDRQLSGMAITIVAWAFLAPNEYLGNLSDIEESIFLLLCAEAL